MNKYFINVLKLIILILSIPDFVSAQCDPGDHAGLSGCPDPNGECGERNGIKFLISILRPADPNEIIGPKGYGIEKYVGVNETMPYKILFENDPDFATAPAQKVKVYMPIPTHLHSNSLRIGDFGFGSFVFTVPVNTTSYYQRLNVKDSLGVYVDVTAGLDQSNNQAFWVFESIDTATGLASTLAPNIGFLPINDSVLGNGEGFVTLTLQPTASSQSWDSVKATASIYFDNEAPILTNTEFNIIDADKPQSHIDSLPASSGNFITLNWSVADAESGIKNCSIYYSANNGPYQPLLTDTSITTFQFLGQSNTSYRFYSIATDNAGNREDPPIGADDTTMIGNTNVFLNIKAFIQSLYISFETMQPALMNQGVGTDATITDSIIVELRDANFPYGVIATTKTLLHTNGIADAHFESVITGDYFISVRHRSAIQTWSSIPINIHSSSMSYNFASSASQAYGSNMIQVSPGVWAFYNGDLNFDGNIDLADISDVEAAITAFSFGYFPTDLNGDGNVDIFDVVEIESNINNFIFSWRP